MYLYIQTCATIDLYLRNIDNQLLMSICFVVNPSFNYDVGVRYNTKLIVTNRISIKN